jgi:hypothetical protein
VTRPIHLAPDMHLQQLWLEDASAGVRSSVCDFHSCHNTLYSWGPLDTCILLSRHFSDASTGHSILRQPRTCHTTNHPTLSFLLWTAKSFTAACPSCLSNPGHQTFWLACSLLHVFLYVCASVFVCVSVCAHVCVYVFAYVCLYLCLHVYLCVIWCFSVCVCLSLCVHVCPCVFVCTCVCVCVCVCVCLCVSAVCLCLSGIFLCVCVCVSLVFLCVCLSL